MATHSSVLAWRIPGMGEPGGLLYMGSHRVGHDCSDLAAAAAAATAAAAAEVHQSSLVRHGHLFLALLLKTVSQHPLLKFSM